MHSSTIYVGQAAAGSTVCVLTVHATGLQVTWDQLVDLVASAAFPAHCVPHTLGVAGHCSCV
jgi:hypothetical protein